jgi:hypothetical protein
VIVIDLWHERQTGVAVFGQQTDFALHLMPGLGTIGDLLNSAAFSETNVVRLAHDAKPAFAKFCAEQIPTEKQGEPAAL